MRIRKETIKCCSNPNVKDLDIKKLKTLVNWTYYCKNCHKTWTEFDTIENYRETLIKIP